MLEWALEERGGLFIGTPRGRVDETTWQAFGTSLSDGVARAAAAAPKKLIVDFAGLDYMSSRGLRALTLAKRDAEAAGVTIILAGPNEIMREILAISRYDKLFVVTASVDDAL